MSKAQPKKIFATEIFLDSQRSDATMHALHELGAAVYNLVTKLHQRKSANELAQSWDILAKDYEYAHEVLTLAIETSLPED